MRAAAALAVAAAAYAAGRASERERARLALLDAPPVVRDLVHHYYHAGRVWAASPAPGRTAEIMRHGFPGLEDVRSFDDYVLSYDRRARVPRWACEHLTADALGRNPAVDRAKCDFTSDDSLHPFFRATNSDYKGSGYDRGHLAAAGNHRRHQTHVQQTFLLTNIAPQVGKGFNRHAWNRLEKRVRKMTDRYAHVHCCTGPLYLPELGADGKAYVRYPVIGANAVAVPTHFFKMILGESADGHYDLDCYCMPNRALPEDVSLDLFKVPPEQVEKAAGLLFFERIPRAAIRSVNGKTLSNK